MEYQGYFTKEELLSRIEQAFPFIPRPIDSELFAYDNNDLMCKIIKNHISGYTEAMLPYEGVIYLYDELGSLTYKGMQWLLPSLLRIIVEGRDLTNHLHLFLIWYFENSSNAELPSAYNFSWLSPLQIDVLICLLEYISETFGEASAYGQENLRTLKNA